MSRLNHEIQAHLLTDANNSETCAKPAAFQVQVQDGTNLKLTSL